MPTIEFLGFVRPKDFFPEIDVLVVPSLWHDISPKVIDEANEYGVPVISSNRGGMVEKVEEGRTGFLFDPDYPSSLTEKMQRFIRKPDTINYMQAACLERVKELTAEKQAELFLEVYSGVLRNSR